MGISEEILSRIDAGESYQDIATNLKVGIDQVNILAKSKIRQSSVEILQENLRVLQKLIPTAEKTYEGSPDVDNADALTKMISTALQTIREIENRKDPAILLNEILGRVLQPVFRDFIKHTTVETGKARGSLDQALPPEYRVVVDVIIKDIVKGIGRVLSSDYKAAVESLAGVLGCRPKDVKVAPILKVVNNEDEPATASPGPGKKVSSSRSG